MAQSSFHLNEAVPIKDMCDGWYIGYLNGKLAVARWQGHENHPLDEFFVTLLKHVDEGGNVETRIINLEHVFTLRFIV